MKELKRFFFELDEVQRKVFLLQIVVLTVIGVEVIQWVFLMGK